MSGYRLGCFGPWFDSLSRVGGRFYGEASGFAFIHRCSFAWALLKGVMALLEVPKLALLPPLRCGVLRPRPPRMKHQGRASLPANCNDAAKFGSPVILKQSYAGSAGPNRKSVSILSAAPGVCGLNPTAQKMSAMQNIKAMLFRRTSPIFPRPCKKSRWNFPQ